MSRSCSPFKRGECGSRLHRHSPHVLNFFSGAALQVVTAQANLRRGNVPVNFFNPIRRPYPRFLAPNFLTVTQNGYTRSQSSKNANRGFSTRARKRGLDHLREKYVDTNKVFDFLSQAGLDVKASGLMKGKDLGVYFCYGNRSSFNMKLQSCKVPY